METSFENWSKERMKDAMQGFDGEGSIVPGEKPYSINIENIREPSLPLVEIRAFLKKK